MSRQKYFQAEVTFPGGRTFIYGVKGRSLPAALLKAYQQASEAPGIANSMTIRRLYSRHHTLHRISRR